MNKFDHERGVFALYTDLTSVNQAKEIFKRNNFPDSKILLLESFNDINSSVSSKDFVYKQKTSVQIGAFVGGVVGFFVFGFVEVFFNINPTLVTFSDFSKSLPLLVLPLKAFLGILAGGTMGALIGVGCPKSPAKRYGFYLKEGGFILVVHSSSYQETKKIRDILQKTAAEDINVLKKSEIWRSILPERNRLLSRIPSIKSLQSQLPY